MSHSNSVTCKFLSMNWMFQFCHSISVEFKCGFQNMNHLVFKPFWGLRHVHMFQITVLLHEPAVLQHQYTYRQLYLENRIIIPLLKMHLVPEADKHQCLLLWSGFYEMKIKNQKIDLSEHIPCKKYKHFVQHNIAVCFVLNIFFKKKEKHKNCFP